MSLSHIISRVRLQCPVFFVNSLSNDKFLDVIKLKAFADDKLNVAKMTIFLFDRAEKHGRKREMLVTSIFSFYPQCFPKLSCFGSLKVGIV